MPNYLFEADDTTGQRIRDIISADTENVARTTINEMGYAITKIAVKQAAAVEELHRLSMTTKLLDRLAPNRLVDYGGKGLLSLPAIRASSRIELLNLSQNQLASLPPGVSDLPNLRELYLDGNHLDAFPTEICDLTNLIKLELSANGITSVPPTIGQLTNLVELDLANNKLTSLPSEISELNNLVKLDLRHNRLCSLPSEFGRLVNLRDLFLHGNPMTTLEEIAPLVNLERLFLSSDTVTDDQLACIANLGNLAFLLLDCPRVSDEAIDKLKNALPKAACGRFPKDGRLGRF